jgi:hypothetical protein
LFEVNNLVDSKIDKIKPRIEDERLKNRGKIDQAEGDAKDAAIEQVIDKATRATKDVSKKPAPAFDTPPQQSYN